MRRLEGMAAVVALAYRTGEPGASDMVDALALDPLARVVQPRPLSEAALAGMLGSELGEAVDPGFCAACREATGGNPLLVTELLRALETEHVRPRPSEIARVRRIGAVAVGPAVRRRLAVLGEDVRAVARALAILGESARRDDLAGTSGIGVVELEDMVAALVGAGDSPAGGAPVVRAPARGRRGTCCSDRGRECATAPAGGQGASRPGRERMGAGPASARQPGRDSPRCRGSIARGGALGARRRALRRQRSPTSAGRSLNWTRKTTRRRCGLKLACQGAGGRPRRTCRSGSRDRARA